MDKIHSRGFDFAQSIKAGSVRRWLAVHSGRIARFFTMLDECRTADVERAHNLAEHKRGNFSAATRFRCYGSLETPMRTFGPASTEQR